MTSERIAKANLTYFKNELVERWLAYSMIYRAAKLAWRNPVELARDSAIVTREPFSLNTH
jgi:hypothetical protein